MHMSHTSAHMPETYAYTRNTTHVRFMHGTRVYVCVCMHECVYVCGPSFSRAKISSAQRVKVGQ